MQGSKIGDENKRHFFYRTNDNDRFLEQSICQFRDGAEYQVSERLVPSQK